MPYIYITRVLLKAQGCLSAQCCRKFWFYPPWLPEELCGRCPSEASKQSEVGAEKLQEAGRLPEQAIAEELLMN